jgi:NAD(P)-dependent dehydrogenase (short-subunit alcohol dehydrogenase family)
MPVALITGASAGLGRALAIALAERGWTLVIDARNPSRLYRVAAELEKVTVVRAIPGDVAVRHHREELTRAVEDLGSLDVLMNNASTLGPSPLPALADLDLAELSDVIRVDVLAPLGLIQTTLPLLRQSGGLVLNISSDAAVAHYEGWGGYGSAKAALDHLTGTLAAENSDVLWYAVDPGDMRTEMHQAAFPGEDISDRPTPESVVPSLLSLIDSRPPSGRYRAAEFATTEGISS